MLAYEVEPFYTVITRSTSAPRSNEYMPHEKTVNVQIRLTLYTADGRSIASTILKQSNDQYVEGTPDKAEPEPPPTPAISPNAYEVRRALGMQGSRYVTDTRERPYR